MRERPMRDVPRPVIALLATAVIAQGLIASMRPPPMAGATDLPRPPPSTMLRLAAFGEEAAAARLLTLWLQAFDYQAGARIPYRELDYVQVVAWLGQILALDPIGQYPLLLASRIYAEVPDAERQRRMLDFVYRAYLEDPERRWPAMAHAAVLAKHRLKDLPLARKFARTLQENTTSSHVPVWVRQMEFFILEEMNELEAARILLGGMIASGQVKDARDLELLKRRLDQLEGELANRPAR